MSKVWNVPRNSFYHWLRKEPSKRCLENGKLTVDIIKVHQASRQIYGSPRIAEELQSQGIAISKPRVARLMQAANIRSILRKKYVATTDSKHKYPVALNLLDRKFHAGQVGRFWVSDTTYIRTLIGWAYLTTVFYFRWRARCAKWLQGNNTIGAKLYLSRIIPNHPRFDKTIPFARKTIPKEMGMPKEKFK